METRSSYTFIRIGLAIRLLQNLQVGNPKSYLDTHLEMLREGLRENGFSVSMVALGEVTEAANEIAASEGDHIASEHIPRFTGAILHLEKTVYAEAETKMIYVLEQRRFTTEFLLERPDKLLRSGEYDVLTALAQYDLNSACKCLLFGQSTATAFHVLRATEEVLKQLYYMYKKQNRLKKPMWGPMVEELRAKRKPKPSEVLLNSLDNIRVSYRNPTQHPSAIYDIDSAQNLFGLCLDVISTMASELKSA